MPFRTLQDLPDRVQDNLPKHGEEIYLSAYNSAWEQYKDAKDRQKSRSREETAHAVAWSAVENVYEKNDKGEWVKKSSAK
ncbi:MAG: cation transport regulator [Patescibacteria group bacterium]|nr:cation transport regulator [Patescibacteria group bacterium]